MLHGRSWPGEPNHCKNVTQCRSVLTSDANANALRSLPLAQARSAPYLLVIMPLTMGRLLKPIREAGKQKRRRSGITP
jgi:hypothetical protein